jgi:hypothetical protein
MLLTLLFVLFLLSHRCNLTVVEVLAGLKGLTDIEEQMIALVKPCMQVHYTKGHQLCFQDHIINFFQNIDSIAESLPRLPEDLNVIIICAQGI